MERLNKFLYGLGTGVIIGTAAGLLLAPKTGKETRQIFADRSKPTFPRWLKNPKVIRSFFLIRCLFLHRWPSRWL